MNQSCATFVQLRSLAASLGLPAEGPLPQLASDLIAGNDLEAVDHIALWTRKADPESNFARSFNRVLDGSNARLAALLVERGYDGLIYSDPVGIVAHCFFQRRENELHAFAVWNADRRRNRRFIQVYCFDFVAFAAEQPGIERVRLGTGRPYDRFLRPLNAISQSLGWHLRRGGWVDFLNGRQ